VEYDQINTNHNPEPARPILDDSTCTVPPPTKPIKEEGEILESEVASEHKEGEVVLVQDFNQSAFHNHCRPWSLYLNIVFNSIASRFKYILIIILMLMYRIDERYVKGGSDFVCSFLGNCTWWSIS